MRVGGWRNVVKGHNSVFNELVLKFLSSVGLVRVFGVSQLWVV